MKRSFLYYVLAITAIIALAFFRACRASGVEMHNYCTKFRSLEEFIAFTPKTAEEIRECTKRYAQGAHEAVAAVIAVPDGERTFENTVTVFDVVVEGSNFAHLAYWVYLLEVTHPDATMREAAHEAYSACNKFLIDHVQQNRDLFRALKAYAQGNGLHEQLDAEQRYFLRETLGAFERAGLDLPDKQRAQVGTLKKELADLVSSYTRNMASDVRKVVVERREELEGLSDAFVDSVQRDDDGRYLLSVDSPTSITVLEECAVEETRKRMFISFYNRANPSNEQVLRDMIATRDALAKLLGYASFAAYDIADQMAKTPEGAEALIREIIERAQPKEDEVFATLKTDLPPSVSLTSEGKLNAWDIRFAAAHYRRTHLALNEQEIAEYFPLEKTIEKIFSVFGNFLGVAFAPVSAEGLWHEEVRAFELRDDEEGTVLGYLMLDLFPRPHKYSHMAAQLGFVSPMKRDGERTPGFSVILGNFTRPQADGPALMKREEVWAFCHELGHAMHSLLSACSLASHSGINACQRDFVEVPSQTFEQWFWEREVLKSISSHVQTGDPLPDHMIDRIIAGKQFGEGYNICRQGCMSLYSLELFSGNHDPEQLLRKLYAEHKRHEQPCDEDRMYLSFSQLAGYGSKYYSYFWSEVIAHDLFAQMKKAGLTNREEGKRFISTVLGRGTSADPNDFVHAYLGRDSDKDAFLKAKGLI